MSRSERTRSSKSSVLQVPLRLIDATLPVPAYQTIGSAAFDLYARQTTVVGAHVECLIPLNVVVQVPLGYVLLIAPRSSTLRRKGLLCGNSVGVIDNDYAGPGDELQFVAYNCRNVPVSVERGERIAQGLFVPIPQIRFVDYVIPETAEDRGGFGSTGADVLEAAVP